MGIPVSVILVARHEALRLPACLEALTRFNEIWVVDSASDDGSLALAQSLGAKTFDFHWNGQYPKKRQWCLDHLHLSHEWIFFVDADEIVPPSLIDEMEALFSGGRPECDGYFITGLYQIGDHILEHGFPNRKLALFDRRRFCFPVVNDLDIGGMGEIEGHYQPVTKEDKGACSRIGHPQEPLFHLALEDEFSWAERHKGYANWEAQMTLRQVWPRDPVWWRQKLKVFWRGLPFRAEAYFILAYILLSGWRDGVLGRKLAVLKYKYYKSIYIIIKNQKQQGHYNGITTNPSSNGS